MSNAVEYRPFPMELRINGWLFSQIFLVTYNFDHAKRFAVQVEDQTFGKFEVSSNMVVEWKLSGRWYQTTPSLVIDKVLSKGDTHEKADRRNRKHGGC